MHRRFRPYHYNAKLGIGLHISGSKGVLVEVLAVSKTPDVVQWFRKQNLQDGSKGLAVSNR